MKNLPSFDIKKFSFAEMTSNTSGKTSGSGTMGVLICTTGCFCFLFAVIVKCFKPFDLGDILVQCIALIYAGAFLLGYRKSKNAKLENLEPTEKTKSETN